MGNVADWLEECRTALRGNGVALKSGDQGAWSPITSRLMTKTNTQRTPNMAQGLFSGLLSPLFDRKGMDSKIMTVSTGPIIMAMDSILCGMSANSAKKGTMYQSGLGEVCTADGSGGLVRAGAPKKKANKMISITMSELKRTSRQAALGQKGMLLSTRYCLYQAR